MIELLMCITLLLSGCASMGNPSDSCGQGYKIPGCDPSNPYSTPLYTSSEPTQSH